jgi:SEC-C motif
MLYPPKLIHRHVRDLCEKIVPGGTPVWVSVEVMPGAQVNECFPNVQRKIATHGGSIQHGWTIWERPGLFIEGEFHGVWVSPEGTFIDVSPKVDGETEILFLPDPVETFDEQNPVRRDNIRLVEYDHPVVHEFLDHFAKIRKYEQSCTDPANPRQFKIDRHIYEPMLYRQAMLEQQMVSLPPGRNAPCRCGSAKKYKKCCGK